MVHGTTKAGAATAQDARPATNDGTAAHFDVLIVGAGISGLGAAYHLTKQCPDQSFVVLEAQEGYGGTWRTHRYPGIRSDSDLFTFGYRFKPWTGPPIATAEEILSYLGAVIEENDLGPHIRYGHRIERAAWSSERKRWTLDVTDVHTGACKVFTCGFLWMCQGYYRHDQGYTPEWPGMSDYAGRIVHPQTWPDDLTLSGKRVVVIGSGATAATLVPNIADVCAHVTVLQRSPTWFRTGRNALEIVDTLRALEVDPAWIHEIARRKILYDQDLFARKAAAQPEAAAQDLMAGVKAVLGDSPDIARHFTPTYRPWRQRIAYIPDADLLQVVRDGKASMVTDEIECFTKTGLKLKSGATLDADIIVTATGFHMSVLGDIPFEIDGARLDPAATVTYRGMMFAGVPNMAWIFGYFRTSWTMRVDLVADFVCRLLNHMRAAGEQQVTPTLRTEDAGMALLPWIDPEDFNPGYLVRAMHTLPKRGAKREWQLSQDYWREKDELPAIDLADAAFVYR
jgi:cation diffusion facilitator CzcD-associated flavoprotein CzcO